MGTFGKILLPVIVLLHLATTAIAAITGLERVASGLSSPMFATHAPGDTSRLFIVQRGGAVRILDMNTGSLLPTPFLTMTDMDTGGSEGGFLGFAFHPDYFQEGMPGYGKVYAKVTTSGSALTVRIREFEVSAGNPDLVDPGSLRQVLSYTNPAGNHVGGWIGFSPNDDYLYIANGDGGGSNDSGAGHTEPNGNAQDITNNWLGKMLRVDPIDPDPLTGPNYAIPPTNPFVGETGDDEIWAYGLRNPFRGSFDRLTGDLWIGDVGQGDREEVDFQPASSPGGENYGWRFREGSIETPASGIGGPCNGCTEPVYDYERPISNPTNDPAINAINQYRGTTVIGGYVYRGPDPSLQGQYFFLDRNAGSAGINYWTFDPDDPDGTVQNIDANLIPNTGSAGGPVSMGEDANGNLYITYFSGEVFRIRTNELLPGDYNADGQVNDGDVDRWRLLFGRTGSNLTADGNRDNVVDAADYTLIRKFFGTSVNGSGAGGSDAIPEPITGAYATQVLALAAIGLGRVRRRGQSRVLS